MKIVIFHEIKTRMGICNIQTEGVCESAASPTSSECVNKDN